MTKQEILNLLSAINKHCGELTKKDKRTKINTLANCVLGLSAIIKELIK